MPVVLEEGGPCSNPNCKATFTRAAAWYRDADDKPYCHHRECMRAAGVPSAQLKRGNSEVASSPLDLQPPAGAKLVEVAEVLGQRYINPGKLTSWQVENDVEEGDEEVEFLVQGRFSRHSRDKRGVITICWLPLETMLRGGADASDVKTALEDYGKRCSREVKEACKECR